MTVVIRSVSLKVLEAWDRDAGRGVIRVDAETMEALGASAGDILEVLGRRRTVAKCLPLGDQRTDADQVAANGSLQPVDRGVTKIDRMTRENARVSVGETVTLRRVQALPANYVEIMSLDEPPSFDARYIELALNGVPVSPGDVVMVPQAEPSGKERYFQIVSLEPPSRQAILMVSTIFGIVSRATEAATTS
jgi:transitional endoplasmic reticulum ATPase